MIFLIPAVIAALLISKNQLSSGLTSGSVAPGPVPDNLAGPRIAPSALTPVIKNSVGSSLSSALGNSFSGPAYYSSGNPGTPGMPGRKTTRPASSIQFSRKVTRYPIGNPVGVLHPPTISNPGVGNVGITQNDPAKPVMRKIKRTSGIDATASSALTNPSQAGRVTVTPEWPAAFWTKTAIGIKRVSKT